MEKKEIEKKEVSLNIAIDKFVTIVKVIVYLYNDYSRKFCLIAQSRFQDEAMDKPSIRSFFKEVILHSNGQSYETLWKCVRSKRPSKAAWTGNKGRKEFYTITYWNAISYLYGYSIPEELKRLLISPIENRFRNVSADVLKAIEYFRNIGDKQLKRRIGRLGIYSTNAEVCSVLWKAATNDMQGENAILYSATRLPDTKKFRHEFFQNPMKLYSDFHNYEYRYKFLGDAIKDHNYFWSLYNAGKCQNNAPCINEELFQDMVHVSGPAAVIQKIIASNKESMEDSAAMYNQLRTVYDADRLSGLLRGSFREIHDRLIPEYNRIRGMLDLGYGKSYEELRDEYRQLIHLGASKDAIKAKRREVVDYLSIYANRRIRYSKRQFALESMYDGIKFVLPKYTDELEAAGRELHNCVGSYKRRVMDKESVIVFMEQGGKRVGCIELNDEFVNQAYGPCNRYLEGAADEAFNVWVKDNELDGGRFVKEEKEDDIEW